MLDSSTATHVFFLPDIRLGKAANCSNHFVLSIIVSIFFNVLAGVRNCLKFPTSSVMMSFPTKLRDWLKTKQGMGRVMEEIKKRKAIHSCRIGMIDISIGTLKVRDCDQEEKK